MFFQNVMFPYPNMQQLNLDWIMQRVGECPQVIQLPALPSGYTFTDLTDIIDNNVDVIPKGGFSILVFGDPRTDATALCGYAFILASDHASDRFFTFHGRTKIWLGWRYGNVPWLGQQVTTGAIV